MLKVSFIPFRKIYRESPVSLSFCIFSLFLVNGSHALYVNPGCFKCISAMNLSPANKNFVIILLILYPQNEIVPSMRT